MLYWGHRLINISTVTPSQVTTPVPLEALAVAVGRTDGRAIARLEVWSPRTAPSQGLGFVHLLLLHYLPHTGGLHLCGGGESGQEGIWSKEIQSTKQMRGK